MDDNHPHEEIKMLLMENQRLLRENNQMLHKMRRATLLSAFFRVLWLAVVVGLSIYAYFEFVEPNLVYMKKGINYIHEMSKNTSDFKELYDKMKGGQNQN